MARQGLARLGEAWFILKVRIGEAGYGMVWQGTEFGGTINRYNTKIYK